MTDEQQLPTDSTPAPAEHQQAGRDQRGRFQPGRSGNPRGRAKGSGWTTKLRTKLRDAAEPVLGVLYRQAMAGDIHACSVLLARILPPARPDDMPVKLSLPADASMAVKAELISEAATTGEIPPATATTLLAHLEATARIIEVSELAERVAALEAQLQAGVP